jgi:hypothetical protein
MGGGGFGQRRAVDVAERGDVLALHALEVVAAASAAPNHGQAQLVAALAAQNGGTRGPHRAGGAGSGAKEFTATGLAAAA